MKKSETEHSGKIKQDKSVLIISYFFPPVGGAGVQRAVKFTKYLGEYGWKPTVLTVSNPSVPVFDKSLEKDIPQSVNIVKAKTLEPGYETKNAVSGASGNTGKQNALKQLLKNCVRALANLVLQPDPQILWFPAAYRAGKKLLKEGDFDVILATAPPFSSFILSAMLSRASGKPLILDYRDEWDISNSVWENKSGSKFTAYLQKKMQNFAINRAAALLATTTMSVENLESKVQNNHASASVHCLYNGYDHEDFSAVQNIKPRNKSSRYVLTYTGTLWNLTSIEPLVNAIALLAERKSALPGLLELRIIGRRTADQNELLKRLDNTGITLTLSDYLPHDEAISLMRESDGLCLLLSDYQFAGRVIPAKVFEYLACKKTILAIAPEGDIWKILEEYPGGHCLEPGAVEEIAKVLAREVEQFQKDKTLDYDGYNIEKYSRKSLTGQLAEIMDTCIK